MEWLLLVGAIMIGLLAIVHSILGEKAIISRIMRRPQPELFGSDDFTKRTLRFVWHALTIVWMGMAFLLGWIANGPIDDTGTMALHVIAAVLVITAATTIVISKARHLSWILELVVAGFIYGAVA